MTDMPISAGASGTADYSCLYTLLIEDLQEYAIFLMDYDGRLQTWNPGVERILGYSRDEWIGRNVSMIFTPEALADKCPEEERNTATRLGHSPDDGWHLREDGSRLWVDGIVSAVHDQSGTIIGFSKIMRDSTDRYNANRQLREGAKWWKQIVDTAAEGICILDKDGKVAFANRRFCEMLGFDSEHVIGRSFLEFAFDEDRPAATERFKNRLRGEEAAFEYRLRRGDGIEVWVRTAASPIRSESGEITGVLAMMSDITEDRFNQEGLKTSEERLRIVLASARDYAIVQIDSNGRVTGWSPGAERIFGWLAAEVVGRDAGVLFTPEERQARVPQMEMESALATGSAADDRWMLRKDGSRIWVTGALMPLREPGRAQRGFVKLMRDFTERKRREEEAQNAIELERKQLHFTIESTQKELQQLAKNLIRAQDNERRRIARELHDDVAQDLALLAMHMTEIEDAVGTLPEVKSALSSVRAEVAAVGARMIELSRGIHSAVLEQLGLSIALRSYCDHLRTKTGRGVTLPAGTCLGHFRYRLR